MMDKKKCDINCFIVGAKCLGHYGGYESFLKKLLEYHKNNNIKYLNICNIRLRNIRCDKKVMISK